MRYGNTALLVLALTLPGHRLWSQDSAIAPPDDGATSPGLHLVVAKHVTEQLGALADTLTVETVRCLIGITRGKSAVIDMVWEPPVSEPTQSGLGSHGCPLATIAVWHNHLPAIHPRTSEEACFLSEAEISDALEGGRAPIQIVQVTAAISCWWTREQIAGAADGGTLVSLPGQRRGIAVDRRRVECRGDQVLRQTCA